VRDQATSEVKLMNNCYRDCSLGSYECNNDPLCSIICRKFLEYLGTISFSETVLHGVME